MNITTVTRKGQVTVPIAIREALGLREGDRVEFRLNDGSASLIPVRSVIERTAGIFRARRRPLTAEQLRRAAEDAMAADVAERMKS